MGERDEQREGKGERGKNEGSEDVFQQHRIKGHEDVAVDDATGERVAVTGGVLPGPCPTFIRSHVSADKGFTEALTAMALA